MVLEQAASAAILAIGASQVLPPLIVSIAITAKTDCSPSVKAAAIVGGRYPDAACRLRRCIKLLVL